LNRRASSLGNDYVGNALEPPIEIANRQRLFAAGHNSTRS
jgi:hypothetical protein